jgi:hypothetical protein
MAKSQMAKSQLSASTPADIAAMGIRTRGVFRHGCKLGIERHRIEAD